MSKYLIDTSSLTMLARYYHPFDTDKHLTAIVRNNFERGFWLLHNAVKMEAERIGQGIIFSSYPFLKEIKPLPATTEITPKQHKKMDNNWVVGSAKNKLGAERYSNEKQRQINGADFQLILTAMDDKDTYLIVTEETGTPNDNKLFKKIPIICKQEGINCITLPDLFLKCGVQFSVK